jgi:hypothetical protein
MSQGDNLQNASPFPVYQMEIWNLGINAKKRQLGVRGNIVQLGKKWKRASPIGQA